MGRLHTRYAPVRRSPSEYCYSMLPLDLHVLSLSLAFILSQDQTLRCNYFVLFFSLFSGLSDLQKLLDGWTFSSPLFISCTTIILSLSQRSLFFAPPPPLRASALIGGESGCKSRGCFVTLQIFSQLFSKNFSSFPIPVVSQSVRLREPSRPLSKFPPELALRSSAKGLQKYSSLPSPSKFFTAFFQKFFPISHI